MNRFLRSSFTRALIMFSSASASLCAAGATAAAQAAIPTVDVREEIRIQSSDAVPDMLLTAIERLAVLPDGRMATSHPQEAIVRVFDPSGRLIKTVGRRGDGPGEFRTIRQVGYVGDKLWVEDLWRGFLVFDAPSYEPIGRVVRPPTAGFTLGLTSDSSSFHYTSRQDPTRVSFYDRLGERELPVDIRMRTAGHRFEVPWSEVTPGGTLTGRSVSRTLSSPLGTATQLNLVPGGREVIVLEASELWNGPPGQFTIRRIDVATRRISAPVTVVLPARRVTRTEADSLIRQATPVVRQPQDAKGAAAYRAKARVPAVYPAFMSARPSADGVLWLTEYARPDTRLVVDLSGRVLMRVRLPADLRVLAVSRTHVWGLSLDADDLPIISRYRVQK